MRWSAVVKGKRHNGEMNSVLQFFALFQKWRNVTKISWSILFFFATSYSPLLELAWWGSAHMFRFGEKHLCSEVKFLIRLGLVFVLLDWKFLSRWTLKWVWGKPKALESNFELDLVLFFLDWLNVQINSGGLEEFIGSSYVIISTFVIVVGEWW